MTIINTNVKSLIAQDSLRANNNKLSQAMERLSTGSKVNSAKDDAAGLAIGTRMTAQVRGLSMAIKNANDGINLVQTSEGAMNEVTDMLQRMRELAVVAGNSTNTDTDRAAMNDEITQLKAEIDRVAGTTRFNGMNILDGSFAGKLQIGNNADQTMDLAINSVAASVLGERADGPATQATRAKLEIQGMTANAAAYQGKSFGVNLNGVTTNVNLPSVVGSTSAVAKIEKNAAGEDQGPMTSFVLGNQSFKSQTVDMSTAATRVFDIKVGSGAYVSVDVTNALAEELGVGINELNNPGTFAVSTSDEVTQAQFVSALNKALDDAGVDATVSVDKHGMVKFNADDGSQLSMRAGSTNAAVFTAGTFISSFIQTGLTAPINAIDLTDHADTGFKLTVNGGTATNVEFSDLLDNPAYVADRAAVTSTELQNVLQTKLNSLFSGNDALTVNIDDEGFVNLSVAGGNRTVTIAETGIMANGSTAVSTGGVALFGGLGTIDNNDVTKNIETSGILTAVSPYQEKNLVMSVSVNTLDTVHIDMAQYLRDSVADLQAATGDEIVQALQTALNDNFTGDNAVTVSMGGDGKMQFAVAGGQQYLKISDYDPPNGSSDGNFVTTYIKDDGAGAASPLVMNSNVRSTADYKGNIQYSDSRSSTTPAAIFVNPFTEYSAYTNDATNKKPFSDQDRADASVVFGGTIIAGETITLTIDATTVTHTITAADVADTTFATLVKNVAAKINADTTLGPKVMATAGDGANLLVTNMKDATIALITSGGTTAGGTTTPSAWSTPVAAGVGLTVTASTNDTLTVTLGSVASSLTMTAGKYSTLEDVANEINLQIARSGSFQGDNALQAVVYSGSDTTHADTPSDVNKYLVLESAGGRTASIAGTFVTAGVGFFGSERNTEINSTRILSSLGQPWENYETSGKVDGGVDTTASNGLVSVTIANGSSTVTRQVSLANQSATRSFADFASDLGSAINSAFSADGFSVTTAFTGGKLSVALNQQGGNTITLGGAVIQDAFGSATVSASGATGEEATLTSMADVADAINEDLASANAGVVASYDAANGKLKFEAVAGTTGTGSTLTLSGNDLASLQFGSSLSATGSAGNATAARISDISLLSTQTATAAMASIDNAIEYVSKQRSLLGAIQNRLEHTVNNLTNIVTNTEASRSAIMDADYGKETSALAKSQILTQAATAMLAQANQSSQTVLSLLK